MLKKTFGTVLVVAVVLGFGWLVYQRLTAKPPASAMMMGMGGVTPVSVAAVVEKKAREFREFPGRIEAVDRAEIRPRVSGTVDGIHFHEGAQVKKGDLLFTLDPKPFAADLARAEAALHAAQAQAVYADKEWQRAQHLTRDRDITKSQLEQRHNDALVAEANVKAAQAAVTTAQLNLGYTKITAPISGKIGRAEITLGNLLQTGGANAPLLTTIVTTSPIYAAFELDEQTYTAFALNQSQNKGDKTIASIPVTVALAGDNSPVYSGFVQSFDNEINRTSGTLRVRALLENADGLLVPGMFAKVKIGNMAEQDYLLINDRAIGTDQDRKYVFVVGAGNKAEYRAITLGPEIEGLRAIQTGLKPGDKIVVNGLQRVHPQAELAPNEIPMPVGDVPVPDATPEAAAKP